MNRLVQICLLSFATILVASVASAQFEGDDYVLNQTGGDPCPNYDSCTMYRDIGTPWAPNYVPEACKRQSCWICTSEQDQAPDRCRDADRTSGRCQCIDKPVEGSPGITYCSEMYGACTYNGR